MKIYFAGSIRGGREKADQYARMIRYIQKKHEVLTEHVGDPGLNLPKQDERYDRDVYQQDTAWLSEADMLIAECTIPSLGVGYEISFAEHRGIPIHLFYDRKKSNLSAMLSGNPRLIVHPYDCEEEIYKILDEIL